MITDLELVEKYLGAERKIKEFKAQLAPYEELKDAIENEFLRRFQERGSNSAKTDSGTAYTSTITNFKVVDQGAFLQFCLQYPSLSNIYTVKPVKDPIKEYMNGGEVALPPGLEQTQFTRINVRRT